MNAFRALRIHSVRGSLLAEIQEVRLQDLTEGDVVIKAVYSGINFKDALAVTGRGKILKQIPLNGGIDVSGTVVHSRNDRIKEGDEVLVSGSGLGERYDGGFSEYVRIPSGCVTPLPPGLSLLEAMILGTPGFTTALALHRLEENHQNPSLGPLVVTGASGGVGSIAVDIFSSKGYEVVAVTGKDAEEERLRQLGAKRVLRIGEVAGSTRPLESALWGGAIDNVGGKILAWLTRTVGEWGNIASIGNAESHELVTTVLPFILRGVTLLGISSANCPSPLRDEVWKRLGDDLKPRHLSRIHSSTIGMEEIERTCRAMLERRTHGRIVVKISGS